MTGWIKVSSEILDNEFVQKKKLITSSYSKSFNSPGLNQILKEIDEMIWGIILFFEVDCLTLKRLGGLVFMYFLFLKKCPLCPVNQFFHDILWVVMGGTLSLPFLFQFLEDINQIYFSWLWGKLSLKDFELFEGSAVD